MDSPNQKQDPPAQEQPSDPPNGGPSAPPAGGQAAVVKVEKPWRFQPGKSGNPAGKPKGAVHGRNRALFALDAMLAKPANQQLLQEALERRFRKDPANFFLQFIMPLLPREALVVSAEKGGVKWQSLLSTFPTPDSGRSTGTVIDVSESSAAGGGSGKPS